MLGASRVSEMYKLAPARHLVILISENRDQSSIPVTPAGLVEKGRGTLGGLPYPVGCAR